VSNPSEVHLLAEGERQLKIAIACQFVEDNPIVHPADFLQTALLFVKQVFSLADQLGEANGLDAKISLSQGEIDTRLLLFGK